MNKRIILVEWRKLFILIIHFILTFRIFLASTLETLILYQKDKIKIFIVSQIWMFRTFITKNFSKTDKLRQGL